MTPGGADPEVEAYAQLRRLVLQAGGVDLGLYKSRCLLRRITLRQRVSGAPDLTAYAALVRRDPAERAHLVQALTIHVSQFFRNPSTFQAIRRQVLPEILEEKRRRGGRALRFWSVGCASGEEPYSLAILLLEAAPEALRAYSCAIYGSDIEPACLKAAAAARYGAASLLHVPQPWRARHFAAVGRQWQLGPDARALVTFRRHNILDAPPFQRIDLVVFRNVLIYMTEALQTRLLLMLHDVLSPGGFLVLGKVEGLPAAVQEHFAALNVAERIFRKIDRDP